MKKTMKKILAFTFAFLICFTSTSSGFRNNSVNVSAATRLNDSNYYYTKKYSINTVAKEASSNVRSAYNTLGFRVYIAKSSLNKMGLAGIFSPSNQAILIKSKTSTAVYHELGHFVDFINDYCSNSSEFKKAYKAEKNKFKDYFGNTDDNYVKAERKEYFAESYAQYVVYPSKLKSARPKTYACIKKAVKAVTTEQANYIKDKYGL